MNAMENSIFRHQTEDLPQLRRDDKGTAGRTQISLLFKDDYPLPRACQLFRSVQSGRRSADNSNIEFQTLFS
jgi:hypothetical protein